MKIGLIGAGIMGYGVALDLLKARHDLTVIAHRNRAPIDNLVSRGATEADSALQLARASDAVVLCVTDSPTARSVIETLLGGLRADTLVIDLTTNDPEAPAEFAAAVAGVGAHYIEAPVTGGAAQARNGALGPSWNATSRSLSGHAPCCPPSASKWSISARRAWAPGRSW